jgi:hypothetical protein
MKNIKLFFAFLFYKKMILFLMNGNLFHEFTSCRIFIIKFFRNEIFNRKIGLKECKEYLDYFVYKNYDLIKRSDKYLHANYKGDQE